VQYPARRRGGTIGWPLLCSSEHHCRTQTCSPSRSERLHAPAPLRSGRVAQPRHSPALRRQNHTCSTLQPPTAPSSCPPPRSPFPAQALSLRLQQHHSPKHSNRRVHPCCARSPAPTQPQPTQTLASSPRPRLLGPASAYPKDARAMVRAAAAPPAPSAPPPR
jgi:hypothetical protein